MSQNSTEGQAPAGTEGQQQQQTEKPPWGTPEEFNPETAFKLIQNLKADKEALTKREALTPEAKAKLAEYDRIEQASKTELERQQQETARWQSESEKWRTQAVSSLISALATDFADPSDAAGALADPGKYLDAGGVIDEARIKADLAALLDKKPHWRRQEGTPPPITRTPPPNGAQGSSGTGSAQTPADLFGGIIRQRMSG
jgi:hypothetical protein